MKGNWVGGSRGCGKGWVGVGVGVGVFYKCASHDEIWGA